MKKLHVLLPILLLLFACSGGDNAPEAISPEFKIIRMDVNINGDYKVGPVNEPIYVASEETEGGRMFLIVHLYNEIAAHYQHLCIFHTDTAEEISEHVFPFRNPLAPLHDPNTQSWITGWELYVAQGKIEPGSYTLCAWISSDSGRQTNSECVDIVITGEGDMPPSSLDVESYERLR